MRTSNSRFAGRLLAGMVITGLIATSGLKASAPGTVDLIATPPELTATVAPNMLVTFDDSGSMAWQYMPDNRPFDNSGWGQSAFVTTSSTRPWFCAPVLDTAAAVGNRRRETSMNGVAYNPHVTYRPPLKADGTAMPNASYTAAWQDGVQHNRPTAPVTTLGTQNLSTSRFCGATAGGGHWRMRATANPFNGDGSINTTVVYTAANWEWVPLPAAQQTNFANWYSYYRTRRIAAQTAMSRALAPFDDNVRILWQALHTTHITNTRPIYKFSNFTIGATAVNHRNEFYDWLFSVPASGATPLLAATIRAGNYFTRTQSPPPALDTNPYWERDAGDDGQGLLLSCRQNFHLLMSDGFWNSSNPSPTTISFPGNNQAPRYDHVATTFPDGRPYPLDVAQTYIYRNVDPLGTNVRNLADVAFHFWASDLAPWFATQASTRLKVPPFLPDRSTNIWGVPIGTGGPLSNLEVYFNPANDPATWPHMVNFMIGFGIDGTIPVTDQNLMRFRRGENNPLTGLPIVWPNPVVGTDDARKLDDMWHASVNSRGRFFVAANPEELITSLQEVVANITARRAGTTALTSSIPLLTGSESGYAAGFDSSDWSGTLTRNRLSVDGGIVSTVWEAGCILTGGFCPTTGTNAGAGTPPDSRRILTSNGVAGSGKPFRWANLSNHQRNRLNVSPATIRLDLNTWTADTHGAARVNYLRGDRTNESTDVPRFRSRTSLLGAIIRGQPTFVSSPTSGFSDSDFRSDSVEGSCRRQLDPTKPELGEGGCYDAFLRRNRERRPMVYVGANDGMLHAFDGRTGEEAWAFVPNTIINNFRLTRHTQRDGGLVSTVDERARQGDVFIDGAWRTYLLGGLRLGGRGIYALDVTQPASPTDTESTLGPKVLWEFANVGPNGESDPAVDCQPGARYCSSLGYTYDSVNFGMINWNGVPNTKWVAFVSSGYFPTDSLDPASTSPKAGQTSLLVIDLKTGTLIREIKTSEASQFGLATSTFGLSTPMTLDRFGRDYSIDVVYAGDLAGNLWRFNLEGDPDDWKVDLMFRTYGAGGASAVGDQPIATAPVVLSDRSRVPLEPMVVLSTGKFVGLPDRTAAIPTQWVYGLRDTGVGSPEYPIAPNALRRNVLAQNSDGLRSISGPASPVPNPERGWRFALNIASEPGERAFATPFPVYEANAAIIRTLIPEGSDPCSPGARYGLMVIDGTDGLSIRRETATGTVYSPFMGAVVASDRPLADPVGRPGGGQVIIPGLPETVSSVIRDTLVEVLSALDDVWNRGAWRELDRN